MINFNQIVLEDALDSGFAIVVDIGKTLSKLSLWSRRGAPLDRQLRANEPCEEGSIRRLDVGGIGSWLVSALARYRGEPVEAIVPVGHGAGIAALAGDELAFAPLDYEQPIPPDIADAYRAERDPFALTGSPPLPGGLNIGSQLFWLERLYPDAMRRAVFVPWAQYWAWFLSGQAASEVSSLGCHSDLWAPERDDFSPMAERLGWAQRFAARVHASAAVGRLRPALAEATGLPRTTRILAGLHDSNAALLASRGSEGRGRGEATLLSTGTWFVAMRSRSASDAPEPLPEGRDCLINVDVDGRPVPSVRFMGGREIEHLGGADGGEIEIAADWPALLRVLAEQTMALPTLVPACGPFPSAEGGWIKEPEDRNARCAAIALYAALMADASLDLIGAARTLIIEGRFARAEVFVRALAALRPHTAVFTADAARDVSFGALRLLDPKLRPAGRLERVLPLAADLGAYRARWYDEIARRSAFEAKDG